MPLQRSKKDTCQSTGKSCLTAFGPGWPGTHYTAQPSHEVSVILLPYTPRNGVVRVSHLLGTEQIDLGLSSECTYKNLCPRANPYAFLGLV